LSIPIDGAVATWGIAGLPTAGVIAPLQTQRCSFENDPLPRDQMASETPPG
jgi:hypothetical protein